MDLNEWNQYKQGLEEEKQKLINELAEKMAAIDIEESKEQKLNEKLLYLEQEIVNKRESYKREVNLKQKAKRHYKKIVTSRTWKMTTPVRKILVKFKGKRRNKKLADLSNGNQSHSAKNLVRDLDKKLWGGFSEYALEKLINIRQSSSSHVNDKIKAARALARWYYDKGEINSALKELQFINQTKKFNKPNVDRVIPEIKVLKKLGRIEEAKKMIWETIDAIGYESELCMAMAHITDSPAEKLKWLNIIFDKHNYAQIDIKDSSKPLSLGNIHCPGLQKNKDLSSYKVSIIIPAYNAADLMYIALDSLLEQTLTNIEIIVVDDCSPDNTVQIVEEYMERDSRIKLIKKEVNEGAYAARNTGLKYVTGDFITIHDSDDYSHPQKLEMQLKEILGNPGSVGSISYLNRSFMDLSPVNAGSLLSIKFIMMNSSSLLVSKQVFEELGGWDSVRVAGDTEFLWRIEKSFGPESIVRLDPKVPLSFALSNENSLTGKSATHVKTIMYGLRRTYRESFQWWHKSVNSKSEMFMDPSKYNRKFACPVPNMLKKPNTREYDLVFVADFTKHKEAKLFEEIIKQNFKVEQKIGVFHWAHFEEDPLQPLSDDFYRIVNENKIDLIVPNESIETNKIIFSSPYVLDYALDSAPEIICSNSYVLLKDGNLNKEKTSRREMNVKKVFNTEPVWIEHKQLNQIL